MVTCRGVVARFWNIDNLPASFQRLTVLAAGLSCARYRAMAVAMAAITLALSLTDWEPAF
ncbi:MAG: hypothetical protein HY669_04540 [Chloroflexi bacterium]|nr:hypothetical protein [Chloroflexota bacterium]